MNSEEIIVITEESMEVIAEAQQGPQGIPGPSGSSVPAIYFNYGDATPANLYTPSSNQVIVSLTLVVLITFNGVGAKVSIGTTAAPELLMDEDESVLSALGSFGANPETEIASGTPIRAFITPGSGATTGRCMVLIEYATA